MNILVVSDDHGGDGFQAAFENAKKKYGSIDIVLHAGDSERDNEDYYLDIAQCPVYLVKGNCDYGFMPRERVMELQGHKFFLCHGNVYGVNDGLQNLDLAAQQREADIVIFGHTHKAFELEIAKRGIHFINPGSLCYPRGAKYGSYVVIKIDNQVNVTFYDMP